MAFGASPLDQPPPSPQMGGESPMASMAGMAPPIPSSAIPPPILAGVMQAAEQINTMFDAFAQVDPNLAGDWGILKTLLQQTLAKLVGAGAPPAASPTAPGANYPGGGFDRSAFGGG